MQKDDKQEVESLPYPIHFKGIDRLHQADDTDGDQLIRIPTGAGIFFYNMSDQPQILLHQNIFRIHISRLISGKIIGFFFAAQWFWK